jgi:hypothetical protein
LARRMQDPLIEFSQLCTSDEEILCLRYHTLQVSSYWGNEMSTLVMVTSLPIYRSVCLH